MEEPLKKWDDERVGKKYVLSHIGIPEDSMVVNATKVAKKDLDRAFPFPFPLAQPIFYEGYLSMKIDGSSTSSVGVVPSTL